MEGCPYWRSQEKQRDVVKDLILQDASHADSCDYCYMQEEGGHFCLRYGVPVKNMDIVRCADWTKIPVLREGAVTLFNVPPPNTNEVPV